MTKRPVRLGGGRRVAIVAVLASAAIAMAVAGPVTTPARAGAAPRPAGDTDAVRAERLTQYDVDMYGQALGHMDWITRAMAVISLSRIDDPRVSDLLLEAMEKSRVTSSSAS